MKLTVSMKLKLIALLFVCVLLLTSCQTDYSALPETYQAYVDSAYSFSSNSTLAPFVTPAENGYYTMIGRYIYYVDKETLQAVPLCNKPECAHSQETSDERIFSCNAFVFTERSPFLQYYDGKLYTIGQCSDENGRSFHALIRISPDGINREYLCRIENPENISFTLHRGYLYRYPKNVGGDVSRCPINRLSDNAYETVISVDESMVYSSIVCKGSKVYYTGLSEENRTVLYSYDTKSRETVKVIVSESSYDFLNVYRDMLIYYAIDKQSGAADYIAFDPETGKTIDFLDDVFFEKDKNINVYSDGINLHITKVVPLEGTERRTVLPQITIVKPEKDVDSFSGKELAQIVNSGANTLYMDEMFPLDMHFGMAGGDEKYLFVGSVGNAWEIVTLDMIDKETLEISRVIDLEGSAVYPPTSTLPYVPGVK